MHLSVSIEHLPILYRSGGQLVNLAPPEQIVSSAPFFTNIESLRDYEVFFVPGEQDVGKS